MSQIVSVHSFRGGTGKSNTTANISALLAAKGLRVCAIDTDINSPGIHVLFGLKEEETGLTLNDFLWERCDIEEAAYDMTARMDIQGDGKLYLVPSSVKAADITRILRDGYDVGLLNDGFQDLIEMLDLDVLMIDTHPGLNEETLLSIAISDTLLLIMRPDQQDIQGTGVTIDVARKLKVPNLTLIVNKAPTIYNFAEMQADMEETFDCTVGAILPHSDELMILASKGIFALHYPDHAIAKSLQVVADSLAAE
ncbi:MAG TPA: MinD/ParA family protein [Chloroflexi bacterium]|nr:MinD/ParA family protein [Chloroflexota bacterium]